MTRPVGRASGLFAFILFLLVCIPPSFAYQQLEFDRELGERGKKSGPRLMNEARAVAVFEDRLYIADTGLHRVLVLDRDGKTVMTWASKGDQPGQLKSPAGISVDEEGKVYVADTDNNRIQVFDAEGRLIRAFGEKGSEPRAFKSPSGLAAQRGFLYVADTGNSRVQVLTSDGIFIRQIAVKTNTEELEEPVAVAADAANRIVVLDAGGNAVWIFAHDGGRIARFGVEGKGADGFDEPQGLVLDSRGDIYVADTGNHKLKKYDREGNLLASLGSKGDGPGQFREASGLAVDQSGGIYVLDAEKNTLQVFVLEQGESRPPLEPASPPPGVALGEELPGEVSALAAAGGGVWSLAGDSIVGIGVNAGRRIGSRGSGPGMLKKPRGLAIDGSGNLWVADTGNDRLQKFSPDGAHLQTLGKGGSGEGAFDSPSGIALGARGNLYVADTDNRRVQVFSAKGVFLGAFGKKGKLSGQFSEPVDIAVDGSEQVYVADAGNNRVSKFDSRGALLWEAGKTGAEDGELNAPSGIALSPDGEVYVLDSGNSRVQVFDADGRFLRKFGCEGRGPGAFRSPQGLALEGSSRLYAGDQGNKRVQVFALRHTPAAPKELAAQAGPNEVKLAWKANSESYFEHYRVYRSDGEAGPFTVAGTIAEPSFTDKDLPSNKTFRYRVSSRAREGNESASAEVSVATPRLLPAAPQKAKLKAQEKQISLAWPPNIEPYLSHYNVYRSNQAATGFELLGKAEQPAFVDKQLPDETVFYYHVTAVGREGDESPASETSSAATPKETPRVPPLEIAKIEVGDLFSSSYKYYESHSIGKVVIKNNTDLDFPKVKLRFSIKDFMDFPTETEIENIPAGRQVELELRPVFSNKILQVTENTPLQTELALVFYLQGEAKTVSRSFPITLYERHALVWDQKEKLGAFVTPKDPPVADFTRAVISPYVDAYPNLNPAIVYARAVYAALGVQGLKYIVDPASPVHDLSGKTTAVDYLQYPRDTLTRKSGDCDDLSTLFAACMEDIGIGTAFVDVPGHVFLMFDTAVAEKDRALLGFPDELTVPYAGSIWIPVEMTMVGSSFTQAWQKGAEEYREWSAKGTLNVISTRKAWELYRPATLPQTDFQAARVSKDDVETKFTGELEALARQRLEHLSAKYLDLLKTTPGDAAALGKLGVLYAENGLYAEALEQFGKILATDPVSSLAHNNMGNVHFLQDRMEDAKAAYEAALKAEPGDAGTMTNLARVLQKLGKKAEAKKVFRKAVAKDPRVLRKYNDLASDLGIVK